MKPHSTTSAPIQTRNPNLKLVGSIEALWSIADAAEYLGISPKTVEKYRTAGIFAPAIVIGRSVRFEPSDVRSWALNHKEKARYAA